MAPQLRRLVMDAGSLLQARDPTALLMSRMKQAEAGTLKVMQTKPGDWECSNCGELNFARNTSCRACGFSPESPVANDEVETFLESNGIDVHAAESFREMPPNLQQICMNVGSLAD